MLEKIKNIPAKPGCYLFKNNDQIIYVGKAKDLQKRVKSYWKKNVSLKIKKMLMEITDIDYMIVTSETEALILELNLIKQYNPKYNVLMRDDKSYPYIELTNEKIPLLQVVRRLDKRKKNGFLFGPYPNVEAARETVNLLNRLYPLRKCQKMPKKACLYFYIDQCLGFCINDIDEKKVKAMVREIKQFLLNKPNKVKQRIKSMMASASANLNYEQAEELKKLLEYVKMTTERQTVEINDLRAIDVFGYFVSNDYMAIQILFLRGGKIVAVHNQIFDVFGDYENQLQQYIINFYQKNPYPNEIIAPLQNRGVLRKILGVLVKKPIKGAKQKLLVLAEKNAQENLINKIEYLTRKKANLEQGWQALRKTLSLKKLARIELFDNSTLFGEYSVSAMVVYENMKPLKKEYRKFKVKNKASDLLNLQEVISRRYQRVLEEKLKKPDLIMVDGGKLQVKAAKKALNNLHFHVLVVGIKKNKKHETNMLVLEDGKEIFMTNKNLYNLVANMQDEVHRFAIDYHRKIRSKGSLSSILDEVAGLGLKRQKILLDNYQTINGIREASIEDLAKIIPKKIAINLKEKLQRM